MISSIDYLDNDASNILSEYINTRKNYDNVLKELNHLIDINICAKYLESFDSYKYHKYHFKGQRILKFAYDLLSNKRQTIWLYNFPTKFPMFYNNWKGRDILIRTSDEDYIIKETQWKLKGFPPIKNKYTINHISMIKS